MVIHRIAGLEPVIMKQRALMGEGQNLFAIALRFLQNVFNEGKPIFADFVITGKIPVNRQNDKILGGLISIGEGPIHPLEGLL